jgi:hypothetical protein
MKRVSLIATVLAVVLLVGGAVFLATWDIPAPKSVVERVLPNDKFPQ